MTTCNPRIYHEEKIEVKKGAPNQKNKEKKKKKKKEKKKKKKIMYARALCRFSTPECLGVVLSTVHHALVGRVGSLKRKEEERIGRC